MDNAYPINPKNKLWAEEKFSPAMVDQARECLRYLRKT